MTDPVDLKDLGFQVAERRRRDGLSLRAAAEQSEVPFNTLARLEKGSLPDLANFRRIVEWLGLDPARFFHPPMLRGETTLDAVGRLLRADPSLGDDAAARIMDIVESIYKMLSIRGEPGVVVHIAPTLKPGAADLLARLIEEMRSALTKGQSAEAGW